MVKRTRRKNKSKKRTNRKRTTRKRTTRRLRGGMMMTQSQLAAIRSRASCLLYCSSCGEGGVANKGLCKLESESINTAVYQCNSCKFKLNNYIAIQIINKSFRGIKGNGVDVNPDGTVKLKKATLEDLKGKYREIVSRFHNACDRSYTDYKLDDMDQKHLRSGGEEKDKPGTRILEDLKKVAISEDLLNLPRYNLNDEGYTQTKKLLEWLPLEVSHFYKPSLSETTTIAFKNAFKLE